MNANSFNVKSHLKNNFIHAIKYHHTLEQGLQDNCFNQVIIEISSDGSQLLITNRRPKKDDKFIYECDPDIINDIKHK